MPDGTRRAIVDITGTKSWTPLPTPDVTSLTTNGRALVGERTAYEEGVLAAMRRAGVRPTDDVMLVGHSEGGMVAVDAARDAAAQRRVQRHPRASPRARRSGSPSARCPRWVQVLALENARTSCRTWTGGRTRTGRTSPRRRRDRGDGTIVGDHDFADAYLPVAADVEASGDRSVRALPAPARTGTSAATHVETHTYQIVRRY